MSFWGRISDFIAETVGIDTKARQADLDTKTKVPAFEGKLIHIHEDYWAMQALEPVNGTYSTADLKAFNKILPRYFPLVRNFFATASAGFSLNSRDPYGSYETDAYCYGLDASTFVKVESAIANQNPGLWFILEVSDRKTIEKFRACFQAIDHVRSSRIVDHWKDIAFPVSEHEALDQYLSQFVATLDDIYPGRSDVPSDRLSAEAIDFLENHDLSDFGQDNADALRDLDRLCIQAGTGFHMLYAGGGFFPNGRNRPVALLSLSDLVQDQKTGHGLYGMEEADRTPELLKRYLTITSIEGGGSWFYDIETDCVFDCDWGDEYGMIDGTLEPVFNTSFEFVNWLYAEPKK